MLSKQEIQGFKNSIKLVKQYVKLQAKKDKKQQKLKLREQKKAYPTKSQIWSEYKNLNLSGLKWTSPKSKMQDEIQDVINMSVINIFRDQEEPIVIAPQIIQPKPKPTYERIEPIESESTMLSDIFADNFETLQASDFPVVWSYKDQIGTEHRYRANNISALENQYNALVNGKSDFQDIEILEDSFVFLRLKEIYIPNRKKAKRSLLGKGNDLQSCNVIDNKYIYCPPSDKCLIACLTKDLVRYNESALKVLLIKNKVYRYNIPQCIVSDIAKLLGVKYNIYRTSLGELRYPYQKGQIILCLINSHWIVLKDKKNLKECYKHALENIKWTDKPLIDCVLDIQQQEVKFHSCKDGEQYADSWIQDFEAYLKNISSKFVPYATGFANLQNIYNTINGRSLVKDPKKLVIQYEGDNCIMDMLRFINKSTKKLIKIVKDKNGKEVKSSQKRNVYIYAHNSANFDSFFYLETLGIHVDNMVEKGGIMSMTLTGQEFDNCNFIIRDTRKFLVPSLDKLCKSYAIPEQYRKSSMNHEEVNESNWLSLKPIWSPYLTLDVISLSLIWIKFIDKMRVVSKSIDVKQYCSIAQLAYSICCKDQKLPSVKDPKLRQFIQRANRGGRVIARTQQFKTSRMAEILKVNRVTSIDKLVGKKLNPFTLKLIGSDYHIAFDATSLYSSAMALLHATYLDGDNIKFLTQDECQDFSIEKYSEKKYLIECDLYAPKDLQFVPLSIKTQWGAQFSTGHIRMVVVNDVDLQECLRFGYTLERVYQGIYSDPISYPFIHDFVLKYFAERALVKKTDSVLGDLYKLILNSSYGKFGQKRCDTQIIFTTEQEVENRSRSYGEEVLESLKLGNGQVCLKIRKPQTENEKLSPHHIAGYILSYSKQVMNNFVLLLGADKQNLIHYMDTDSFYIHSKDYAKLSHIKDELGGGKNDYGESKLILQAEYLGCKSKICYVLDTETMELTKNVTWKGISKDKFEEIGQRVVERVKIQDEETLKYDGDCMTGIDNWTKSKVAGISIQKNCSKKLSINEYCQKYDLEDGIYKFKHIE